MPGNSLEEARFDHVSDTGELVFVSGAGKFAVKIDEALERAILEAKQIRSEVQEEQKTRIPPTLPISQIQSLIRAGADPARVAERYSLSEAALFGVSRLRSKRKSNMRSSSFSPFQRRRKAAYARFPN